MGGEETGQEMIEEKRGRTWKRTRRERRSDGGNGKLKAKRSETMKGDEFGRPKQKRLKEKEERSESTREEKGRPTEKLRRYNEIKV